MFITFKKPELYPAFNFAMPEKGNNSYFMESFIKILL